ncbi:MAG TPA: hypothetical protein VNJ29_00975 [Candidatus Nitrosotenuis sp.]|jgi:hypothetical protein|nr:hypothetical protein [Candidatus Nitrosotenuis sp.]
MVITQSWGVSDESHYTVIHYYLLNKLTGKRQEISMPLTAIYAIHDLRIMPLGCWKIATSLRPSGDFYAPTQVFWDQEGGEDYILLYEDELSSNRHILQKPLEHPVFDLILKGCD